MENLRKKPYTAKPNSGNNNFGVEIKKREGLAALPEIAHGI
jgi:hypothetical protein